MFKRVLCVILAVLLLTGMSLIGVSAATYYNIWVAGVQVTSSNASDVLGDGTVKYAASEKCLYLKNANIKGVALVEDLMSAGIYAAGIDLTVSFSGSNKITDKGGNDWSMGIGMEEGNLTFVEGEAGANLEITSGYGNDYSMGIYASYVYNDITKGGDLSFKSGDVTVKYSGNKLKEGTGAGIYCSDMTVTAGNVTSIGAASASGNSFGVNAYGDVNVEGGSLTAKGSEGLSSTGLYAGDASYYDEDFDEYFSIGGGYLNVSKGAVVTAEAGVGQVHSFGISLARGINSSGTIIATSSDTTKTPGPDSATTSYGIVAWGLSDLNFTGGKVVAKAGYGYDSCGINALWDKTHDYVIAGNVTISENADVTAVSNGGYLYSDGMYVGADLEMKSGKLTVSGGKVTTKNSEEQPESGAIYADGNITVTGGKLTASATEVTHKNGSDDTIYCFGKITLGENMTVKGGKVNVGEEVNSIRQTSFDTPLVISEAFGFILGDVNSDGEVNIKDATAIQKHIAQLEILEEGLLAAADFDGDEVITIKDATAIQKFVAGIK